VPRWRRFFKARPDTKVVVASGHGARSSARRAIAEGAFDFYSKPMDIDELGLIVRRAFHVADLEAENLRLADTIQTTTVLGGIISAAPEMIKVARMIERVATAQASVMLLGGQGTAGTWPARGVVARQKAVHCHQLRRDPRESARIGAVRL
jgi:two-component system NtrC family response regulator